MARELRVGSQGTLGFGDLTKWFTRNGYLKDTGERDTTPPGHLVAPLEPLTPVFGESFDDIRSPMFLSPPAE